MQTHEPRRTAKVHEGPRPGLLLVAPVCYVPFCPSGGLMHQVRAILIVTILPAFAMSAEITAAETMPTETNATKALHELFDRDWEYQMQQEPLWASSLGDRRWNDKWPDESLRAIRARFDHSREMMKQLEAIDRSQLTPPDRVSYDIFAYDKKDDLESE